MEDPYTVFTTGIPPGATAWNGTGGITMCKEGCTENRDNYTITVDTGDTRSCSTSAACIVNAFDGSGNYRQKHMVSTTMYFEHPGYGWGKEIYWTLDSQKMKDPVPGTNGRAMYVYISSASVHEFGHTVGIDDIPTAFGILFGTMDSNMRDPWTFFSPTSGDQKQARAIYEIHTIH